MTDKPIGPRYQNAVPAGLQTAAQLRAAGLIPKAPEEPVAWLERLVDGDAWQTGLFYTADAVALEPLDDAVDTPPSNAESSSQLTVVQWTTRSRPLVAGRYRDKERSTKKHVSVDGHVTGCGKQIPGGATVVAHTADWHLHANCYNCAYRLWDSHGPADFGRPRDGEDFPPARRCRHGRHPRDCMKCSPPKNWSCPNGCNEPHDPLICYPRCTTFPPRRDASGGGRCSGGRCESTELVLRRANPRLNLDFGDGASMRCYHCGEAVCVGCRRNPVDGVLRFCDPCGEAEAAAYADYE
jgi:hypothetical protein